MPIKANQWRPLTGGEALQVALNNHRKNLPPHIQKLLQWIITGKGTECYSNADEVADLETWIVDHPSFDVQDNEIATLYILAPQWQELRNALTGFVSAFRKAQAAAAETKKLPWQDDAPDFIYLADAVKIADRQGEEIDIKRLSKVLTPAGPMRYMRNGGRRCKVHRLDFLAYINPPPATEREIEGFLQRIESRKAKIRQKKRAGR